MSGGVDSSVSAALLVEQGYEVTGVFIKVWEPPQEKFQKVCTWRDDRRDAMRVAAKLGIPFITIDLSAEYKQGVVDYMIAEYKAGRTPNPDVMCNKMVKFGAFYDWAMEQGADYVATGHYAQIINDSLAVAVDLAKDQTYFIWNLFNDQLKHILFPIGKYKKSEVRTLATKFNLSTAQKKDSQGLCFIGKLDVKDFLKEFIEIKKGEVVDEEGKVIGEHDGANFFTIGERHGFIITNKTPTDRPYYVVAKNIAENRLIVSTRPQENIDRDNFINLEQVNWLGKPPVKNKNYTCRFRYRQPLTECYLEQRENIWSVKFETTPVNLTSGQSLVVYDGNICLGGGVIV